MIIKIETEVENVYYFDYSATSYPKPKRVVDKMVEVITEYGANPGRSGHRLALEAGRGIYETRERLANFIGAKNPMDIVITRNATASLNLAIKGLLKKGDHVITTTMEHNSVLRPIMKLKDNGIVEVTILEADEKGHIDLEDLKSSIKNNTKLVVTTHASNVTGTIFPIESISKIVHEKDVLYLVDAAQSAGYLAIDVEKMDIDLLAMTGHKSLLGPQGTGVLYIREGIILDSIEEGGTGSKSYEFTQPEIYPDKFESGTPNTPGIIALGEGLKYIEDIGLENIASHKWEMTKRFLQGIKDVEGIKVYGPELSEKRAPVVPINIGEEDSSSISYILDDEFDIATRPGLHCAPLAHKSIGTFEQGVVRFSFGHGTTAEEIDYAIDVLKQIAENYNQNLEEQL